MRVKPWSRQKSYAVSFMLQDETKTMTDNVIDSIMRKIQQNIETRLNAKLKLGFSISK